MSRPKVNVSPSNDNLGILAPSVNGTSVVLVASPVAPASGYGVAKLLKSKAQVATEFGQAGNEPVVEAFNEGFFAEAPEGTEVYVLAMAPATTLAALLSSTNAEKALNLAGGKARLVGVIKFPSVGYTPTITQGLDEDVHNAVTAAQTLANAWLTKKKPFRAMIQGYGFTSIADLKSYATDTKRNVMCVIGSVDNSTARATLLFLGRAAASPSQRNIGRIKSKSLNIPEADAVKIGTALVDNVSDTDLDTLHTKRYASFEKNQIASGYVITDDCMLTTPEDDYNSLINGRVMDNAVRVAFAAYYEELKDDVDVDDNGRIAKVEEKALETKIEEAVAEAMPGQLSKQNDGSVAIKARVNPDPSEYQALYEKNGIDSPNFNLLQTNGVVYIFVSARPRGCVKEINVFLGYSPAAL